MRKRDLSCVRLLRLCRRTGKRRPFLERRLCRLAEDADLEFGIQGALEEGVEEDGERIRVLLGRRVRV